MGAMTARGTGTREEWLAAPAEIFGWPPRVVLYHFTFETDYTERAALPPKRVRIGSSQEGHMCPACVASTAVMVAGGGSMGGILAICIGKVRRVFRVDLRSLSHKIEEN